MPGLGGAVDGGAQTGITHLKASAGGSETERDTGGERGSRMLEIVNTELCTININHRSLSIKMHFMCMSRI